MASLQEREAALHQLVHEQGLQHHSVQDEAAALIRQYNTAAMQLVASNEFPQAHNMLKKAAAYTKDSSKLIRSRQLRLQLRAITLNNLGCYCKKAGQLQPALEYLQKALKIESTAGSQCENPAGV